jgi:hypothetical protein
MRGYSAHRTAGFARSGGKARMLLASGYDVGQKELRDGSGILMWPTRIRDSETPYSDGNREIDAAEKRRRAPAPPPIKTAPRATADRVRHYQTKRAIEPRKFERRKSHA